MICIHLSNPVLAIQPTRIFHGQVPALELALIFPMTPFPLSLDARIFGHPETFRQRDYVLRFLDFMPSHDEFSGRTPDEVYSTDFPGFPGSLSFHSTLFPKQFLQEIRHNHVHRIRLESPPIPIVKLPKAFR